MTTSLSLVQNGNLVINPHYELAENWWTEGKSANCFVFRDATGAVGGIGTNGIVFTTVGGGASSTSITGGFTTVDPSGSYFIAGIFQKLSGASEKRAYFRLMCYDANSSFVGYAYPASSPGHNLNQPDGAANLGGFGAFTPPATATRYGGLVSGLGTYVNGTINVNAQYLGGFPPGITQARLQAFGAFQPTSDMSTAWNALQFAESDGVNFDYCDGDQDNGVWSGARHASVSLRIPPRLSSTAGSVDSLALSPVSTTSLTLS